MEINNGREGHQHNGSSQWLVRYLNRQGDWLEKTRGNLMVTATVIAAMSFQAMVNPPGGVWQSDKCASDNRTETCKGEAGTAVLEYKNSKRIAYIGMVSTCTVSFCASMSLILLVSSGLRLRNRVIMAILVTFMVMAVLCISAAFFLAVVLVQFDDETIRYILSIYVLFWVVFPVLVLLIQLVRFIFWLICLMCSCCCPHRQRSPRQLPPLAPTPAH
ncbi:PGG domain [Arabidopsis thaliana x Arabidopsis arenosa]|uniref:PGG domain n=1 Tax=Arabidopsis thaliana x Arabidopsis arenosa TaxID=1240361 RepID=A0A8T2AVD9_9BRAS|nr:PGG domain [Arabidopsis thaliana x Arabidopsis arenosa]